MLKVAVVLPGYPKICATTWAFRVKGVKMYPGVCRASRVTRASLRARVSPHPSILLRARASAPQHGEKRHTAWPSGH